METFVCNAAEKLSLHPPSMAIFAYSESMKWKCSSVHFSNIKRFTDEVFGTESIDMHFHGGDFYVWRKSRNCNKYESYYLRDGIEI